MSITVEKASCQVNKERPRKYYVSNNGNDKNDGKTSETAWASLEKVNAIIFNPGDTIYLDAASSWTGQLRLHGSGYKDMVIKVQKYNDGGDAQKRPIINGNGTVGETNYYMFGADDELNKASGAVEIIDSSFWEISGLEITNFGMTASNRRCGIMVINNYAPTPAERTIENYYASKKEHIYIRDCYVHDVNSLLQALGGAKTGGGIIFSGFIDDILVESCSVVRIDNTGIRNEAPCLHGWEPESYPPIMKLRFNNNYVAQVSGDGIVLAASYDSAARYNYITDCGRSYLTNEDGTVQPFGSNTPVHIGNNAYAALWFMGGRNGVAEYNEVVNNPYRNNDGEAFDIDSFCDGMVFQYNYTSRNNGGFILLMGRSVNGIVRYNISVEDGNGDYGAPAHLIHYEGGRSSAKIYNNLFIVGTGVTRLFGHTIGNVINFQNNIVVSMNRDTIDMFENTDEGFSGGEITNNIFYPNGLFQASALGMEVRSVSNILADPMIASISEIPKGVISNPGTERACFCASKLRAFMLTDDSPAIAAGVKVDTPHADQGELWRLTEDIFGNKFIKDAPISIGIHQY